MTNAMKKIIELASWNRREHFEFFCQFDEPFHGLVVNLDCTWAYRHCKQENVSFFVFYLHQVMKAVNLTAAMRYRIEEGLVVDYSTIHASATVGRSDHTFAFCPIKFHEDFSSFAKETGQAMDAIQASSGLGLAKNGVRNDVIHFSAMPWISFTGLTHARHFQRHDSVPKISVGKCFEQNGRLMMPVATYVHHGLADAYHVHQFLQTLETLLGGQAITPSFT